MPSLALVPCLLALTLSAAAAEDPPAPPTPAAGSPAEPQVTAQAAPPAPIVDPLEHFGMLQQLVGACWRGEHADGVTSDTQCYETQWGQHLRGTITISWVKDGQKAADFLGDSVFSWSDQRQRIVFTNWSSTGANGTGEAFVEGDGVIFPGTSTRPGAPPDQRHRWTRTGPDEFLVVRERRKDDAWQEVLRITYHRVPKPGAGEKKVPAGQRKAPPVPKAPPTPRPAGGKGAQAGK